MLAGNHGECRRTVHPRQKFGMSEVNTEWKAGVVAALNLTGGEGAWLRQGMAFPSVTICKHILQPMLSS